MPEFKFVINGTTLSCLSDDSLTTGNVGTYKCSFIFADGLRGMTWFAAFKKNGRQHCAEIENGSCEIPQNMLDDSGTLYVGVFASMLNDPSQYKRLSTNFVVLKVNCGAYDDFLPGAPSLWERVMMKINSHSGCEVLDHPDGSVTWDKLNEGVQAAINDKSLINNLTDGTAPNSLQTPNSQAISEGAVALGKNSIAGSKGFAIKSCEKINDTTGKYTLDSVAGLEVGMSYSVKMARAKYKAGLITAIDTANKIVTVDGYPNIALDETTSDDSFFVTNYLFINERPELGTIDIGKGSMAFGEYAIVQARSGYAEGLRNIVLGEYGHAEGRKNIAGWASHAEGLTTKALGDMGHSEGYGTEANGLYTHAEGANSKANGNTSHAEGNNTKAIGLAAHSEGHLSEASGESSHAEGHATGAKGLFSHAEGYASNAVGNASHAEGSNTLAAGQCSHTEGLGTIASGKCQHVSGVYNEVDNENKYAHIIGGGTSVTNRKNIHTVDWNGQAWYADDVISKKYGALSEKLSKDEVSEIMSTTANALKGIKTGSSILTITDISPTAHEDSILVSMPNKLTYPYNDTTKTLNGITFTDNGDGTITVNGTTTYSKFVLSKGTIFPEGIFVISGSPADENGGNYYDIHLTLYSNNAAIAVFYDKGNGSGAFDCSQYTYDRYELSIHIYNISSKNITLDNVVFRPKLSVSPTTTTLTVKNENDKVQATYTPNADGSVSGVKSVYPVMKLGLSDTNADMTVEYNKDINTALSDKADVADISNITDSVDKLNSKKADKSNSYFGFEGGGGAFAKAGGAIGESAIAGDGFAGGKQAQTMSDTATPIDAVQLGKGRNKQPKTLQVYDHQLMDADGNIPAERLKNAPAFKDVINVTINNSASWNWDDISELKTIYGNGSYLVNISAVGDNADCHDTALLITKSETTNSELDSGKYTQALITSDGAILYRESYWTMAGPQDWSTFSLANYLQERIFKGTIYLEEDVTIDESNELKINSQGMFIVYKYSPIETTYGILIADLDTSDDYVRRQTLFMNGKTYIRTGILQSGTVKEWSTFKTPNLENDSVTTITIKDKAVTAAKLADDVQNRLFNGYIHLDNVPIDEADELKINSQGIFIIYNESNATSLNSVSAHGILIVDYDVYNDKYDQTLIYNQKTYIRTGQINHDIGGMEWTKFETTDKIKEYGVRWKGTSSTVCERLGDAVGLTAKAHKGSTESVDNDFDNIYPWSDIKTCNIDADGNVLAYLGEPSFARDGTNGDVMVEIPKFYYKRVKTGIVEEIWICGTKLPGYELHPLFIDNGKEVSKVFHSVYNASSFTDETDNKVKLQSITGVQPRVRTTRANFRTYARNKGAIWGIEDISCVNALQLLYLVEYANTHSQSALGSGADYLSYTANHKALEETTNGNTITIASTYKNTYKLGQRIEIGTSQGANNKTTTPRTITAITTDEETGQTTITFDGDPITIAVGNMMWNVAPLNGSCDALNGKSGWVAGDNNYTDGYADVNYRGIEGFHAKLSRFIDGANIKERVVYYANSMSDYADGVYNGKYRAVGYTNAEANGYVSAFGYDEKAPWVMFPSAAVGGSSTFVPDYYYQNTGERLLLLGGAWSSATRAGAFYFYCFDAFSYSFLHYGSHLLVKKP